jgi:hypothetical protein
MACQRFPIFQVPIAFSATERGDQHRSTQLFQDKGELVSSQKSVAEKPML